MAESPEITHVKLYKDNAGEWRFTAIASNGEAIVVSSEGYTNKQDAMGAIDGVFGDAMPVTEDPE